MLTEFLQSSDAKKIYDDLAEAVYAADADTIRTASQVDSRIDMIRYKAGYADGLKRANNILLALRSRTI